jgi:hypothetical protein
LKKEFQCWNLWCIWSKNDTQNTLQKRWIWFEINFICPEFDE